MGDCPPGPDGMIRIWRLLRTPWIGKQDDKMGIFLGLCGLWE